MRDIQLLLNDYTQAINLFEDIMELSSTLNDRNDRE